MTALASNPTTNPTPLSLADYLALVPDPRHDQGKRHSLAAVLRLVAAAILCGMRSLQAIAQFGRHLSRADAATLGFTHSLTPCKSTLSEILRLVEPDALAEQLRLWAKAQDDGDKHLALDGPLMARHCAAAATARFPPSTSWLCTPSPPASRWPRRPSTARPTSTKPPSNCCTRCLWPARSSAPTPCSRTATSVRWCATVAATTCCRPRTTNRPCGATSRPSSPRKPKRGFPPLQQGVISDDQQWASEVFKGHGRVERRSVRTSTLLNEYLDWPGVKQVFWLRRERTQNGHTTVEDLYGISSLSRELADASNFLELLRDHWGIENGLHYVRDVTLGEDASRVRKGSSPLLLASLRNAALVLLESLGLASIAEATRACVLRPKRAFRLLFT